MITALPDNSESLWTDGEVHSRADSNWNACFVSVRHPFRETANEDSLTVIRVDDETAVFAVADGCGGMRGGEIASKLAMQILASSVESWRDSPSRMRAAILDGIESANEEVRNLKIGAACTIAVIEYHRGYVRPYHVGDSRILVMGGRGRVRYQSICHSPVGFAVESGMLHADEAMQHEDRYLVSNVVGCESMRIEIGPTLRLGVRDTVLLASDGLFDNITIDHIVDHLRKGKLERNVKQLVSLASARMLGMEGEPCKPDDLSLIALRPNPRSDLYALPRKAR